MASIWDKEQLKQARLESELNVKNAAERLEIRAEYLSMIENGHREPSQKLIAKMAELYRKPVGFFLEREKKFTLSLNK